MSGAVPMTEPRLRLTLVPRLQREPWVISPDEWVRGPGQGIDRVEILGSQETVVAEGQSLYWLYPTFDGWIFGGVALGAHTSPSYLIRRDGRIEPVAVAAGMPDLERKQVKLGWWR